MMWENVGEFFKKTWKWIQALWDKHDDHIESMIAVVLPMVIELAFRNDLSGDQKRKAIVDAIVDNAEAHATEIGTSMINEAVELAANRYNIQIGKLTREGMDAAVSATVKAGRDYTNGKLKLTGTEAEEAGVTLSNEDLE